MKVRMKIGIASADWAYAPKQVVDIDDDLAVAWLNAGIAEPVREQQVERAVIEPDEKAGWDLKMEPEEYLERYPDGKHAEIARRIVEG